MPKQLNQAEISLGQIMYIKDSVFLVHGYGVESNKLVRKRNPGADRKGVEIQRKSVENQGKSAKIAGKSSILGDILDRLCDPN